MITSDHRIFTNNNCTGCNRCIAACTVPEANIALIENGRNKIHIDAHHCINCGKCIEVCPHNARDFTDDTEEFLDALARGEGIAVLFAPAVRSNFQSFEHLLGLLRSMGCRELYDSSFGADITTWAYLRTLEKLGKKGLISQPCPAVVNYIEKHDPFLISSLVPVHSPAMCAGIYMRKYAGVTNKIAFISPCIAKKDEFEDPNTHNTIQYNVTFKKLMEALKRRGKNYLQASPGSFDHGRHGLGAIYPAPGGLKENVLRALPEAWVFQVEGQPEVRHFLDDYIDELKHGRNLPVLVDILNCAKGCNLGTGAIAQGEDALYADRCMYAAKQEALRDQGGKRKFSRSSNREPASYASFDKTLRLEDFSRRYTNKKVASKPVTAQALEEAFQALHKTTEHERHIDCCSCGFDSCEDMAAAIAKGINHVENCVEYHKSVLELQKEEMQALVERQNAQAEELRTSVDGMFLALSENAAKSEETAALVSGINQEVAGMSSISSRLQETMDILKESLRKYIDLGGKIVDISAMTKLLSLNASVEAAHAQGQGRGFSVVAEQMKLLSGQSGESASEIISSNEEVFPLLDEVRRISDGLNERAAAIVGSTSDILLAINDIAAAEQRITHIASELSNSAHVQV